MYLVFLSEVRAPTVTVTLDPNTLAAVAEKKQQCHHIGGFKKFYNSYLTWTIQSCSFVLP